MDRYQLTWAMFAEPWDSWSSLPGSQSLPSDWDLLLLSVGSRQVWCQFVGLWCLKRPWAWFST